MEAGIDAGQCDLVTVVLKASPLPGHTRARKRELAHVISGAPLQHLSDCGGHDAVGTGILRVRRGHAERGP